MSVVTENGCTVITGKGIERFRLMIAIQGLETHIRTNGRLRLSRVATPKRCMEIVSEFTKKKYKRSDAKKAAEEGRLFLREEAIV